MNKGILKIEAQYTDWKFFERINKTIKVGACISLINNK